MKIQCCPFCGNVVTDINLYTMYTSEHAFYCKNCKMVVSPVMISVHKDALIVTDSFVNDAIIKRFKKFRIIIEPDHRIGDTFIDQENNVIATKDYAIVDKFGYLVLLSKRKEDLELAKQLFKLKNLAEPIVPKRMQITYKFAKVISHADLQRL